MRPRKRSVLRRQASHRTLRYQDPWIQQYVRGKAEPMLVPPNKLRRLRREYPRAPKWVSCSSIYRWLKKGLLEQSAALQVHLRHYKHQHGRKRTISRDSGTKRTQQTGPVEEAGRRLGGRHHRFLQPERLPALCVTERAGTVGWFLRSCSGQGGHAGISGSCLRTGSSLKTMNGDQGKRICLLSEWRNLARGPLSRVPIPLGRSLR